jgi:S1-C subfamily serine protease
VPFAGPAAEPPRAAQAPAAPRQPQIASPRFALRRGVWRAALPLAHEGTRRLSERTLARLNSTLCRINAASHSICYDSAMGRHQELTQHVPWSSLGVETVASRVGRSIVAVGALPFQPTDPKIAGLQVISQEDPSWETYLMNIVGTAIQGGDGKLVTCAHVVDKLASAGTPGFILARVHYQGAVMYVSYPIQMALRYLDPRVEAVNPSVDLAVLLVAAKSTPEVPYDTPVVEWGRSEEIGVGHPVVIVGYPYGKDMFLFTESNRGVIQPTFYSGIVSAVLPVTKPGETRLLQLSIPAAGGMSGGAVFDPSTGKVLGMVTSCLHTNGVPQPISWAIPSEVLAPYVEVITFSRAG